MRKLMLGASVSLCLIGGCAAKPPARPAAASAPRPAPSVGSSNPVIVHVVSRDQTVTISSSPQGLRYSLKDADGRVHVADFTAQRFAALQPELYRQLRHYIAVYADDAPLPADAGMAPVPAQVLDDHAHAER